MKMSNLLDISAVYTINKGFYRFLKNLEPPKNRIRLLTPSLRQLIYTEQISLGPKII